MNKNILYLGIAVGIGVLTGYVLFGSHNASTAQEKMLDDHEHVASDNQIWTCSMHPQIMQSESGDCPICGMDLIPRTSGESGLEPNEIKMTENAMALANIQTSIIGNASTGKEKETISLSGKIVINEDKVAIQPAHFNGRIEKLYVTSIGESVKKGQAVATIYSPELVAAQQELMTTYTLRESQPQLYKAVRNKFKNWKIHDSQLDEVIKTGKTKTSFTIYSHVSGVVSEIGVSNGAHIMDGKPIFKVTNLNTVWAEFDVYENQISQFKKGQKIKVSTNAYPNKQFDAVISFIDPILNTSTRTVTVRTTLENKKSLLKPGMFVSGKIQSSINVTEKLVSIPASALLWTGKRSLVYVKTDPNSPVFEMREVIIGTRNTDSYTIVSGLKNGDEIVTNGTFTVDAAAQLQGKKSMMNKPSVKTILSKDKNIRTQENSDSDVMIEMKLPESVQIAFQSVLVSYLQMKDAFVASDANQVSVFAKATSEKMQGLMKSDLGKLEKEYFLNSIDLLTSISSNKDLEKQRSFYVTLNENLIALITNVTSFKNTLYIQKCPMANSNKGAVWLSTEKEIRNPYFGDEMLTCGSTIEVIPSL
ncbi:efflux RND transporter periplasmic adaptor subunit [Aquimarina aggregata]|uniref:efflux RND transporter periplasmic adaptor subunit n=1 Tax=Aquimarina aggregata TaxID=1642818 RepID=UPI002492B90E|nr:efflux RND transporter periplasmic adaptor subunit [Aquimarina aggregata]